MGYLLTGILILQFFMVRMFFDKFVVSVQEYIGGLSLYDLVSSRGFLPPEEAVFIFEGIVEGLKHIHGTFVAHRDIKLENVMLSKNNVPKLIDFGFSTFSPLSGMRGSCYGSRAYVPPEFCVYNLSKKDFLEKKISRAELNSRTYDLKKADIWSLGVLLFTMVQGSMPFNAEKGTQEILAFKSENMDFPRVIPEGLKQLNEALMNENWRLRPDINNVELLLFEAKDTMGLGNS